MIEPVKDKLTHLIVNEILKDRKSEPFFLFNFLFAVSGSLKTCLKKLFWYLFLFKQNPRKHFDEDIFLKL